MSGKMVVTRVRDRQYTVLEINTEPMPTW